MYENKCAHCGAFGDAECEFEAEHEEGIPAFRLCKPCARLMCVQLSNNVVPYLCMGYGPVARVKRVAIIKNFINQK